jgi:hypothetical protein
MKRVLGIALTAATIAALPPAAVAGNDSDETPTPYFVRGPRIIHVPQRGESDERVEYRAKIRADLGDREDHPGEAIAPRPRRHVAPPEYRRAELPPRRKPFNASPPPSPMGPPRAVLSAPPPRVGDLTPIHPTPHFEATAAAGNAIKPHEATVAVKAPPVTRDEPNGPSDPDNR